MVLFGAALILAFPELRTDFSRQRFNCDSEQQVYECDFVPPNEFTAR